MGIRGKALAAGLPERWRTEERIVGRRTTGEPVAVRSFVLRGDRPGPSVYVQANVHGSEIAGVGAIWELFRALADRPIRGSLRVVPHCNPWSSNERVGDYTQGVYDVATGRNWNRSYRQLAQRGGGVPEHRVAVDAFARRHEGTPWAAVKRAFRAELAAAFRAQAATFDTWGAPLPDRLALALQEWTLGTDLVLDLHTGDTAPRYLYLPGYARTLAAAFAIPFHLELGFGFGGAMDEAAFAPWYLLAEAFAALGREVVPDVAGFTVELGSMERIDEREMKEDAARLLAALAAVGMVEGAAFPRPVEPEVTFRCAIGAYRSLVCSVGGLLLPQVEPGTAVRRGQVIARLLAMGELTDPDRPEAAMREVTSPADGILLLWHASRILRQGDRLCSVMTGVERVERGPGPAPQRRSGTGRRR